MSRAHGLRHDAHFLIDIEHAVSQFSGWHNSGFLASRHVELEWGNILCQTGRV